MKIILTLYPMILIPYYVYSREYIVFILGYGFTVLVLIILAILILKKVDKFVPKENLIYPNNPRTLFFKSLFFYGLAFVLWVNRNYIY